MKLNKKILFPVVIITIICALLTVFLYINNSEKLYADNSSTQADNNSTQADKEEGETNSTESNNPETTTANSAPTIGNPDKIKPTLTLSGYDKMSIYVGSTYIESGYTATDVNNVDLTSRVQVTGAVNTKVAGTYTINYSVEDDYQLSTTATRTVTVIDNRITGSPDDKIIHLTFDDGPSIHTKTLLDLLDKYNVKATFFVVGNNGSYSWMAETVKRGHSIGLHSTTHKYDQIYVSKEAFFSDLYNIQDIVYQSTGIKTYLMRFPGGSSNTISKQYCNGIMSELAPAVTTAGFEYFDWNVSSGDAMGNLTRAQVRENIINGVQRHTTSVVLQHDLYPESIAAVEDVIQWGLANGYSFQPLTMDSFNAHQKIAN